MAGLLDTAQQRLMGLLNVPTEVQRFATNPQAFLSLLGVNKLPQATGFAAGATGLPPKNVLPGGVLNPPNLAYQQGYEQGEPFSYAAMASPLAKPVGKVLAPKAYDMLENYMVQTGGLLPLTAYHGTPHTIQGKFDISKVGTGEGAQAYGHGMYFAENPAVAKEYQKLDPAGGSLPPARRVLDGKELQPGTPEYHAGTLLSRNGVTLKDARNMVKSWIDDPNAMFAGENTVEGWKKTLDTLNSVSKKSSFKELPNEGNLYKVDIPDEYIPNMLDWDKPLAQQNKQVLESLKKLNDPYINEAITTQPKLSKDGEYWEYMGNTYGSKSEALDDATPHRIITGYTGLGKTPAEVSQTLNNAGIKGINYLDQNSRIEGQGTRNFVVFDPSDVKILEKNSQKVEGLLGE